MPGIHEILCAADAIVFEKDKRFPAGWGKPIYFDVRDILSSPRNFDILTDLLAEKVREINPDKIAGAFTGGIPLATAVSLKTNIPMIFVRKDLKGKFRSQIEGQLAPNEKVLLIDDLIHSGTSKIAFINGIRKAGGIVKHALVVVDYGTEGKNLLKKEGVELLSLATVKEILAYMKKSRKISDAEYSGLLMRIGAKA